MRRKTVEFNDNNTAVAYLRYSSSSQNEASIDQQREMAQRWAAARGITIIKDYPEPAKSGTNMNRPKLNLMLQELPALRPGYVITWKNDRLGRDRGDLLKIKAAIRNAGARLEYVEGISPSEEPESVLLEGFTDAFAEYYSLQLSVNIKRGQNYNAERALSNGRKIFGYVIDGEKRYQRDDITAPIVESIFADYIGGKSSQRIADSLNNAGVRTARGKNFTAKTIAKILKNRAYLGEYSYGEYVIPGGMPQLISDTDWDLAQKKLAKNRYRGAKTKAELNAMGSHVPEYWITGVGYCSLCGGRLEGVSGTSKTGRKYRYYYCLNQRRKKCTLKPVRKDALENTVESIIDNFLENPESLASLAVDLAAEYKKAHGRNEAVMEALELERKDVERQIGNFVKAIAQGIFTTATAQAMNDLEQRKSELDAQIQTEHVKNALMEDEGSIGAFFKKFAQAKLSDPDTREMLLEYFIDSIWLGSDGVTITSWFYENGDQMTWERLLATKEKAPHALPFNGFDTRDVGGLRGTGVELCSDGDLLILSYWLAA